MTIAETIGRCIRYPDQQSVRGPIERRPRTLDGETSDGFQEMCFINKHGNDDTTAVARTAVVKV